MQIRASTQELGAPAPIPEACSLDDPDCEACQ
jgi:ribonucleoside-diphosphate reductase alpha chain